MATPQTTIAATTTSPRRRIRGSQPRHPEDHRDRVDDERHQHDRVARQIAEPLRHRGETPPRRALAVASGRHRRQPHGRPDRRGAAHRVEQIQRRQVDPAQQHPGQHRADDRAELKHSHVQRVGRGQLFAGQHPRDGRRAGWLVDRVERLLRRQQAHHHPHVVQRERGLHPQQHRRRRQPAGGEDQHDAAVHRVGPRASPQPEHCERYQREQTRQAHVRRVLCLRVDLHRDGEDRQVRPDDGDDPGPATADGSRVRAAVWCRLAGSCDQGCRRCTRPPLTRIRLCIRFSRPCQNSTTSGATR
jgi:hypothetical protein